MNKNILELLDKLDLVNKNMGVVSRGAKRDTTPEAQPSMLLLKKFQIGTSKNRLLQK